MLRLLLRASLCCCLLLSLLLSSGCTTTPVPIQPVPPAKPTQCLLEVPDQLNWLPAEFNQLAQQRLDAETEFRLKFLQWTPDQRNDALQRILDIDNRMTQLVVANKTADGKRYQTAVAELKDCQEFVKSLP